MRPEYAKHFAEIKTAIIMLGEVLNNKESGDEFTSDDYETLVAVERNLSDEVVQFENKMRKYDKKYRGKKGNSTRKDS